jgi:hypothetical protein
MCPDDDLIDAIVSEVTASHDPVRTPGLSVAIRAGIEMYCARVANPAPAQGVRAIRRGED